MATKTKHVKTVTAEITFGPDKNDLANSLFTGKWVEFTTTKGRLRCRINDVSAENDRREEWNLKGELDSGETFTGFYNDRRTTGKILYDPIS